MQTAVVGHPISHSLSPLLHNAVYKNLNIDARMSAYDVEDIGEFVKRVRELSIHLVAVTLPHKLAVMQYLDEIDQSAKDIGAVNTILHRGGRLEGYNTDIAGIEVALWDMDLNGKKALIIGAGGASQPLAYFLVRAGANVSCYSRDPKKTRALAERFGCKAYGDVPKESDRFDLIANATPLGLKKSDPLPVARELLKPGVVVFDLIYTPTSLVREAETRGATAISGLSMFIAQGLEQERLWLGRDVPDTGYTALLQAELAKRL